MNKRPVVWLGTSYADLLAFPGDARRLAGYALSQVQLGEEPPDWRPMPSVGRGVNELRVRTGRAFRILYVAKHADAVYVLHAFEKKTSRITLPDLALARRRLAMILIR